MLLGNHTRSASSESVGHFIIIKQLVSAAVFCVITQQLWHECGVYNIYGVISMYQLSWAFHKLQRFMKYKLFFPT